MSTKSTPRGAAKADTCLELGYPDGWAMVIKKQRWGSAQEVVHTDVDGCEYFAYTIYECELKAEIRPADASGSGSGSGSGSAEECSDYETWRTTDGFLCSQYQYDLCEVDGFEDESSEWFSAKEACCKCGGGKRPKTYSGSGSGSGSASGSGSGSGSGSAGPTPDDFDPKSPLTSYIDHRACGPRGDDAKADTSACPDGRAMVIKKQSIEKDADGGWEVIHTDVDGCEYFAYTIYECEPNR